MFGEIYSFEKYLARKQQPPKNPRPRKPKEAKNADAELEYYKENGEHQPFDEASKNKLGKQLHFKN